MSDIAIAVENLGKLYRIGAAREANGCYRCTSLREALASAVSVPFHRMRRLGKAETGKDSTFWALRDVSFEVKRGEVLGIIGRNGSGKSTLLKILSRITEPTTGRIKIRGRVASLLEVGTGFHPELTGRENIFMNGAILGMRRNEIQRKFDEIVAFADVEKFLETPVKHYSSGMYVRLAFAVAAHLEQEILVVDEVLAVGDAEFQAKCLGKLGDIANIGRTILFVSHNLAAVSNLCSSALLLSQGRVLATGTPAEVVPRYTRSGATGATIALVDRKDRKGTGKIRFEKLEIVQDQHVTCALIVGKEVTLALHYRTFSSEAIGYTVFSIAVYTILGHVAIYVANDLINRTLYPLPGTGVVHCTIPKLPLSPGTYELNINCEVGGETADWIAHAARITVAPGDFYGSGKLPPTTHGGLLVEHDWTRP